MKIDKNAFKSLDADLHNVLKIKQLVIPII